MPASPLATVGSARWRMTVPKYLQVPLGKALAALENNEVTESLRWFGDCMERMQAMPDGSLPPEAKPVLYFGAQAAVSAYFAKRGAGQSVPFTVMEQYRDMAGTLSGAAFEAAPDDPVACHNFARFLQDDGRDADAEKYYYQAIQLDSSQVESWGNLGTLLYQKGEVEKAWAKWRQCLALEATMPSGRLAQAYIWLRQGDYEKGWAAFYSRWADLEFQRGYGRDKEFGGAKHWEGEPLKDGESLLLHGEQGLGDHVQFARYANVLQDEGLPLVGLETRPILKRWMAASFPSLPIYARGVDPLPSFTHHCSTMDLPHLLGTTMETVPKPVSPTLPLQGTQYITGGGLRVGLAWHGAPGNPADALRSIPNELLQHLGDIPGITWVSLQFGEADAVTARAWLGERFIDGTDGCEDTLDTAAVMRGLDLIVTVDTLTAHLAGTLGVPTWVLHRYCREWRWLDQGEQCPWYPSVRSLTQAKPGDWEELLRRVRAELEAMAHG